MKKTRYSWFGFSILVLLIACETTDPASLVINQHPVAGLASSGIALQVLPPANPNTASHPLQIDAMRAREYPGSDIVIESVLDPGDNYNRYYVSYLSDGLKIYALMTVPTGSIPSTGWPVVIFNHGYIPPEVYRTTERYIAYMDQIARSGYILFRSDYRGHDRSEGEAGGVYSRPNYTVDVLNAVASVKRFPEADRDRIGMWGHSMGGYITLRSMVISADIKAGVIWAGVVAPFPDLFTRWNPGARETAASPGSFVYSLEQEFGSKAENPEFWNSISANAYLRDLYGPIQIHTGTADADVPWQFSEMLYNDMLAANQVAEFYTYEGDNHNISNSFSLAMQRTVEFFDRYLKGIGG
jgi:dipeptidyl aminopeptidase/acylaminoacyl peptidase